MKQIAPILMFVMISCNPMNETESVSNEDIRLIRELHEQYREYWLRNDSAKVVNLFAENGALLPPNNPGDFIRGKEAIGRWWFLVTDETTYPITDFVYNDDSLVVTDSKTAVWEGVSTVSWNTVVKDSILSSSRSSSNFITLCVKVENEWKILRQIWNARPEG